MTFVHQSTDIMSCIYCIFPLVTIQRGEYNSMKYDEKYEEKCILQVFGVVVYTMESRVNGTQHSFDPPS
jgi:hypothetical protein